MAQRNKVLYITDQSSVENDLDILQKWLFKYGFKWPKRFPNQKPLDPTDKRQYLTKRHCLILYDDFQMRHSHISNVVDAGERVYELNSGTDKKEVMYILSRRMGIEFEPDEQIYLDRLQWDLLKSIEEFLKKSGSPSKELRNVIDGQIYKWRQRDWLNALVLAYEERRQKDI